MWAAEWIGVALSVTTLTVVARIAWLVSEISFKVNELWTDYKRKTDAATQQMQWNGMERRRTKR